MDSGGGTAQSNLSCATNQNPKNKDAWLRVLSGVCEPRVANYLMISFVGSGETSPIPRSSVLALAHQEFFFEVPWQHKVVIWIHGPRLLGHRMQRRV